MAVFRLPRLATLLLALLLLPLTGCYDQSDVRSEPEHLADSAASTAQSMFTNPDYGKLLELTSRARAVLIYPNILRGAFIFGARGGTGVLLTRDPNLGTWSNPAFYSIGGVNWGLQIGGQSQSIIIAIMTERGLNAIINRRATLGADASVAAGELGKAVTAQTGADWRADMYAFGQSQGLFVGIALDGSVVWPRREWNEQVYGPGATPEAILLDRSLQSPAMSRLVQTMP